MDDLQLTISRFLDGELTDDETCQLAQALHTNVEALDQFLLSNYIHYQLLDWMDQERIPDHAAGKLLAAEELTGQEVGVASGRSSRISPGLEISSSNGRSRRTNAARSWLRSWGAIAATLVVAACIGSVAYLYATRPVYVGLLSDATNCNWGTTNRGLAVGAMLESGEQLELVKGNAVITFSSGAKLMLEGPTTLEIVSPMEVRLTAGFVAAKVPRQAVNFKVDTSLARFVDLGTEFTLDLKADKAFVLHVFEGMVEVRVDERFGKAAQRPARISDVHAVSFDVTSDDIKPYDFQPGKKMPF
jgi:ferric-dicitrate binding protein FerR (iron transport regulator)